MTEDLVEDVLTRLQRRLASPSSLAGLSEPAADLLAAATAHGIIGNGGLRYWFEGMDRASTLRAATAFERLGLPAAGAAMRAALSSFPNGAPPTDFDERLAYLAAHRPRLEHEFRPGEEAVWDADFDAAARAFIFARRGEFGLHGE